MPLCLFSCLKSLSAQIFLPCAPFISFLGDASRMTFYGHIPYCFLTPNVYAIVTHSWVILDLSPMYPFYFLLRQCLWHDVSHEEPLLYSWGNHILIGVRCYTTYSYIVSQRWNILDALNLVHHLSLLGKPFYDDMSHWKPPLIHIPIIYFLGWVIIPCCLPPCPIAFQPRSI